MSTKKPPGAGNIGAGGVRKLVLCEIEVADRRLHCGSARLPLAHQADAWNSPSSKQRGGLCYSCAVLCCAVRSRRSRKRPSPQFEAAETGKNVWNTWNSLLVSASSQCLWLSVACSPFYPINKRRVRLNYTTYKRGFQARERKMPGIFAHFIAVCPEKKRAVCP